MRDVFCGSMMLHIHLRRSHSRTRQPRNHLCWLPFDLHNHCSKRLSRLRRSRGGTCTLRNKDRLYSETYRLVRTRGSEGGRTYNNHSQMDKEEYLECVQCCNMRPAENELPPPSLVMPNSSSLYIDQPSSVLRPDGAVAVSNDAGREVVGRLT